MTLTGRCQCGAISDTAAGKPAHHALCHCADCRRSSGAYMTGWALFPKEQVTIVGKPVTCESSPGTYRRFCGTCGTGMFFLKEETFPGQVDIQSATLDDPDALPPRPASRRQKRRNGSAGCRSSRNSGAFRG